MSEYKTKGPIVLGFICAFIVIFSNFIMMPEMNVVVNDIKNFTSIITGFALFVGLIGIIRLHINNITKKKPLWFHSLSLLIILVLFIFVGLIYGQPSPQLKWMYDAIYGPLTATTYSLLAFWVCSAAYRAFNVRTWESSILLITGLLVFFGVQPIASLISPYFLTANDFIQNVLNVGGSRGIIIGIGIGIISLGLRIILGMERSWMGGE
jgi:hypothetical protein